MSYQPKTYRSSGGDVFNVASGGSIAVASGGTVTLSSGGFITISSGSRVYATLPTADPGVAGVLWSDSGTVKVSAG